MVISSPDLRDEARAAPRRGRAATRRRTPTSAPTARARRTPAPTTMEETATAERVRACLVRMGTRSDGRASAGEAGRIEGCARAAMDDGARSPAGPPAASSADRMEPNAVGVMRVGEGMLVRIVWKVVVAGSGGVGAGASAPAVRAEAVAAATERPAAAASARGVGVGAAAAPCPISHIGLRSPGGSGRQSQDGSALPSLPRLTRGARDPTVGDPARLSGRHAPKHHGVRPPAAAPEVVRRAAGRSRRVGDAPAAAHGETVDLLAQLLRSSAADQRPQDQRGLGRGEGEHLGSRLAWESYRHAGLRHDSPREALDRPIVRQTAAAGSWRPVNAPERRIPPRTPPHDGRRSDGPGAGKRRAKRERGKSELTRRVPTCQERVLKPPSQHLTRDPSPTRVWAEASSEAGFGGGRAAAGHGTIAGGATTAGLTCVCRARPAFRRCLSGRRRRRPGEQQLRGRLNLAGPLSPLPEAVFSGNALLDEGRAMARRERSDPNHCAARPVM
ncbi:hypothetical protein JHW43_000701 [Diplocarpon mali]|nr:hypothetical protein JHW43_000701 [Diplocarpon mali]